MPLSEFSLCFDMFATLSLTLFLFESFSIYTIGNRGLLYCEHSNSIIHWVIFIELSSKSKSGGVEIGAVVYERCGSVREVR